MAVGTHEGFHLDPHPQEAYRKAYWEWGESSETSEPTSDIHLFQQGHGF